MRAPGKASAITMVALAVVSASAIAGAWIARALWPVALLPVAAAALFLARPRRGGLFLSAQTAAAGVGALLGLAPGLLLFGVITALGAWDLARLRVLTAGARGPAALSAEREHLGRLALLSAAGAALGGAALAIRLNAGFGLLLLAGALLTVSLGVFARRSRSRG